MAGSFLRQVRGACRSGLADLGDLLMPMECGGCSRPGTRMCPDCTRFFTGPVRLAMPDPAPAELAPVSAAAPYAGPGRAAVLALKERRRRDLGPVLGGVLARAVIGAAQGSATVCLVPVPTDPRVARQRGGCHVELLARHAAAALRAGGARAQVAPVLRVVGSRPDSARLTAAQRVRVRADGFEASREKLARVLPGADGPQPGLVVVDDVVTTGATLAAAGTALRRAADCVPMRLACAVLTATMRRHGGQPSGLTIVDVPTGPTGRLLT